MIVAGIDGGQTSTVAVIGNGEGRAIGRGVAGPADEVDQKAGSTRMHDALHAALQAARASAGLADDVRFDAVVAGVSGYEGRVYGKPPQVAAARFVLLHDAPIAHAGALGGEPGVVVVAGTGSVVHATDGTRGWTSGGWGYLFGDEGSAFWFARELLSELMQTEDYAHGSEPTGEARLVCEFFGLPSLRAVARAFYAGELSRERIASLSAHTAEWPQTRKKLAWGASTLAMLVRDAVFAGAAPGVALVGGMFANAEFADLVRAYIGRGPRPVEVVEPKYEPAAGALLLAYREAGIDRTELIV